MDKSEDAFRTIGEISEELGVAHHILRYWETRFPQLRPMQRAGNRRYYRPDDVALVRRIHRLVNDEGYTIKGVQKLLERKQAGQAEGAADEASAAEPRRAAVSALPGDLVDRLQSIRDDLARALAEV